MIIYNTAIYIFKGFISLLALLAPVLPKRKFMRFVVGQKGVIGHIRRTFTKTQGSKVIWVHCASLGEFGIARPLINRFKEQGAEVVLTFFSPSGYEVVSANHPGIDYVYYLPLDTPCNARRFLNIVQPDRAVFIVSEYWCNYLKQLRKRNIPTFLVSAKINGDSVFFKWYGSMHRRALHTFRKFFVIDSRSKENLGRLGFTNVVTAGNPLFDNAIEKAATEWSDPVIGAFCPAGNAFIAGSLHEDNDLQLIAALAKDNPGTRFIMVPHAIDKDYIDRLRNALPGKSVLYSECTPATDFSDVQSLIIDFVGALAYIYRYGSLAYVGGGFTPYLHSLVEAAVYGLPVSFGPRIERKITPEQMIAEGIGEIVETPRDICDWYEKTMKADRDALTRKAAGYVKRNAGATPAMANEIMA